MAHYCDRQTEYLEIAPFDSAHKFLLAFRTMSLSCTVSKTYWLKIADFNLPDLYLAPSLTEFEFHQEFGIKIRVANGIVSVILRLAVLLEH